MAISFRSAATANTGNSTATSITISKPAGVVAGDLLVALLTVARGTDLAIAAPSGWTLILRTNESTNIATASYYKVAGASEPTSYQWGFTGTGSPFGAAGGISAYVGVHNVSPINASAGQVNASASTSVVTPAVTTTVADALVIRAHGVRVGSATPATVTPPTGTSERWEVSNSSNSISRTAETADVVQAAAGGTGTATATADVSVTNASQTIALTPADTTPPGAPTNLAATPGFGEISLGWSPNPETDLSHYNVYRATASGGPYSKINASNVTTTSYTDTGATDPATRYYYVVRAVDTSGNESANSNETSAQPNPTVSPPRVTSIPRVFEPTIEQPFEVSRLRPDAILAKL
ncbi:MAG: fibronectin type III domain-containing protein, partial [Actinomycetota bacterium]|nr:fibronectin type III domain-containing protein [Actinomycetota bacterium]